MRHMQVRSSPRCFHMRLPMAASSAQPFGSLCATGTARRHEQHLERAQAAGRAPLGTAAARRRIQAEVAKENVILRRHIRNAQPRLASPSAIALLKGGGTNQGGAKTQQEDEEEDEEG